MLANMRQHYALCMPDRPCAQQVPTIILLRPPYYSVPHRQHNTAVLQSETLQHRHSRRSKKVYWLGADNFSNGCQSCSNRQSLLHLLCTHHLEPLQRVHCPESNAAGCTGAAFASICIYVNLPCAQQECLLFAHCSDTYCHSYACQDRRVSTHKTRACAKPDIQLMPLVLQVHSGLDGRFYFILLQW